MKSFSYTLLVEDIPQSKTYYKTLFDWDILHGNNHFSYINTFSPLTFGIIDKDYFLNTLKLPLPDSNSFCSWIFEDSDSLEQEKTALIEKGVLKIGAYGNFFIDSQNHIWELRMKGELL